MRGRTKLSERERAWVLIHTHTHRLMRRGSSSFKLRIKIGTRDKYAHGFTLLSHFVRKKKKQ